MSEFITHHHIVHVRTNTVFSAHVRVSVSLCVCVRAVPVLYLSVCVHVYFRHTTHILMYCAGVRL
jgi:hypothetical protein